MQTVTFCVRVDDAARATMIADALRKLPDAHKVREFPGFSSVETALERQAALIKLTEANAERLSAAFAELRAYVGLHWREGEIPEETKALLNTH